MLKLILVCWTDDDGYNFDLLVWAATRRQAVELWRTHYNQSLEPGDPEPKPNRVFEVPTAPPATAKALDWHREVLEIEDEHPLVASVLEARAAGVKED